MLKAIWTTNPVEFTGKFYTVPRSYVEPKPAQKPHPPIYLAAFAPAALKRLAVMTNGWNPVAIPVDGMAKMFEGVKQMARDAGRDPSSLELIVRANLEVHDRRRPTDGMIFSGTLDQIRTDIAGCRAIGAHGLIIDPTFSPGAQALNRWVSLMEQCRTLV